MKRPLMFQVEREGGAQACGGSIQVYDDPGQERAALVEALRAAATSIERGEQDNVLALGDGTVAGTGFTDAELRGGGG